jgi:beta-lactam-binding protein with PASTA domain
MPGFYPVDEYVLAGFSVGIVEKDKITDGARAKAGDKLIGIASSGVHSNGYSLVRKLFDLNGEKAKENLSEYNDKLGMTIGEARAALKKDGYEVRTVGGGETVTAQMPAYQQTMPKNGIVVLYTDADAERLTAKVPDLRQMTVSQANKYALAADLNIKISGNALNTGELVSYDQSEEPGTEVEYGKTITVYFKSNTDVNDYAG